MTVKRTSSRRDSDYYVRNHLYRRGSSELEDESTVYDENDKRCVVVEMRRSFANAICVQTSL